MIKQFKKLITQEHGASPWLAIFAMTVLLAFVALAVDLGLAYMQASKLQAALDAGALAGASYLPDTASATTAAIDCVKKNGYTASDVTVNFSDSNSKISLSSAKKVDTMFLKVIGISEWNVSRKAVAAKTGSGGSGGGVFGYRLFYGDSGSTYSMGGNFTINGDVHSNGGYSASPGGGSKVTGTVEAVTNLYYNQWSMTVGNTLCPAQSIEMPDFSGVPATIMPSHYDEYSNASVYNKITSRQTWNGSKYITGDVTIKNGLDINGDVYINGSLKINGGGPFIIKGNLYVNGNLTFTNTAYIYGSVMAKGNILFQGGGFKVYSSAPICIYSETGNIDLTAAGTTATGVVYAPNGTVTIAGTITVYGSIVAKKITGWPANLTMGEPSEPIEFLPGGGETTIKLVD